MAHNITVNKLEYEYKNAIRSFEVEMNLKSLTDRINQFQEKNPKLQQLMRKSHNNSFKKPLRPHDSVINRLPTSTYEKSVKKIKNNLKSHPTDMKHNRKQGMYPIKVYPLKSVPKSKGKDFNGVKSTVKVSITPNYPVNSKKRGSVKKDKNFIEANKKNAFSAQKISGFFEHNHFFSTIKESKNLN